MVEQNIVTKYNCALAMLFGMWLAESTQTLLYAKEATTTHLSNMLWNKQLIGIPNVLYNEDSGKLCPMHLVQFGCIGYVQVKRQINKKWVEKSVKCIMVGYADNHSLDTYQR